MPLTLTWRDATSLPIDAESLLPESLAELSAADVARRRVPAGNGSVEVGEVFGVEGTCADGLLRFEGNLRHVRRIGQGMGTGSIEVRGDVGGLLGAEMTGGTIEIEGNAGDWAGAEMRGGLLRIRGQAGRYLGAALPGSRVGMREGVILVVGDVGDDAGLAMRRGLIAISGSAGDGLGRALVAGSILAFGGVGLRPGAGMKRGTLGLFQAAARDGFALLPTFSPSGRYRPPFLAIYLGRLRAWEFPAPEAAVSATLERYNGDLAERGQGEIWVGP